MQCSEDSDHLIRICSFINIGSRPLENKKKLKFRNFPNFLKFLENFQIFYFPMFLIIFSNFSSFSQISRIFLEPFQISPNSRVFLSSSNRNSPKSLKIPSNLPNCPKPCSTTEVAWFSVCERKNSFCNLRLVNVFSQLS